MTMEQRAIIEGAYLMGFEPSKEGLADSDLYNEAVEYMQGSLLR